VRQAGPVFALPAVDKELRVQARTRTVGTVSATAAVILAVMLTQEPAKADLTGATSPLDGTSLTGSTTAGVPKALRIKGVQTGETVVKLSGSSVSRPTRPPRTAIPTTLSSPTSSRKPKAAPHRSTESAVPLTPTVTTTTTGTTTPTLAPTTAQAIAAPASTTAVLPNRSGLSWASGVYVSSDTVAATEAFAAWRGRPVDVVVAWSGRTTWSDIVSPSWLYQIWAGTPYTKVFGVAPIPEGDGSTLAACAAGDYNEKWVQFGNNIKAAGLDDETIVRLGWEFNGDWYKWQADNPAQFAACWRQIYTTTESVAPALRWDWTVNRGRGQSVKDARQAYPGDKYVDFVGVDAYDAWPGAVDEASWNQQFAAPLGLKFWADFAKVHHKLLSIPEWGVYPGPSSGGNSGGDNAFYIAKMEAFFRSLGSNLGYESYFNEDKSYYAGSLFGPAQNPKAAAQYLEDVHP
jgi:hypothetical protein